MTSITNDFHNTEYETRLTPLEIRRILNTNPDDRNDADKRFVRRCRKVLCGFTGCVCGGELSERGKQEWRNN